MNYISCFSFLQIKPDRKNRHRLAQLPEGTTWGQVYGVAILCGIGFTMSLFIGTLAFEHGHFDMLCGVKLGVLVGSVISAPGGLDRVAPDIAQGKVQGLNSREAELSPAHHDAIATNPCSGDRPS
jgi:hypothetical protein